MSACRFLAGFPHGERWSFSSAKPDGSRRPGHGLRSGVPQLPPAAEKARVEELRRAAKADLPDRIGRLSRITGLKYNKLTIRASRTKWGSCTGTNNISLSLFLMTLPEHLRDFVIVHELCHTVHHDHSPKFHALVDRLVGGNEKALNRELKAFSIRG